MKIIETSLRDGQQSLAATRMSTVDILDVVEELDKSGFYALEVWGGATFDSCLRFLNEDPWERLRLIKSKVKHTKLQMLLRGQNLVGYKPYVNETVDLFIKKAIENGIDIIRIFDALNDFDNIKTSLKATKNYGAHAQVALSYTVSPVHNIEYYINLAIQAEKLGADSIAVKDMAGLLQPQDAYNLIKGIKKNVKIPVNLHGHDTSGMITATYIKAIEAGCDMIDTALSPFAGGTSQPSTEGIVSLLNNLKIEHNIRLELLNEPVKKLEKVREDLIQKGHYEITSQFSHPNILISQVPGGMYSNLVSQLKEQKMLHRLDDVLNEIPKVRKDLGYPPLVTPMSQIVGVQATLNVITGERYKILTSEVIMYCNGEYGKAPFDIDPNILMLTQKNIKKDKKEHIGATLRDLKEKYRKTKFGEEELLSIMLMGDTAEKFYLKRWAEENPYQLESNFMLKQNYFKYRFNIDEAKQSQIFEMYSPFNGLIEKILVNNSEHVLLNESIVIIKVNNVFIELLSPSNGTISDIKIELGNKVIEKEILLVVKPF
jgi:oxaloacetate decarboxylase alpha subunit